MFEAPRAKTISTPATPAVLARCLHPIREAGGGGGAGSERGAHPRRRRRRHGPEPGGGGDGDGPLAHPAAARARRGGDAAGREGEARGGGDGDGDAVAGAERAEEPQGEGGARLRAAGGWTMPPVERWSKGWRAQSGRRRRGERAGQAAVGDECRPDGGPSWCKSGAKQV
jgi:hypothetical protein